MTDVRCGSCRGRLGITAAKQLRVKVYHADLGCEFEPPLSHNEFRDDLATSLVAVGTNITQAARLTGVSRTRLYEIIALRQGLAPLEESDVG